MKLSVKTLKGEQFEINVEPTDQISAVKAAIEELKPDLPAARQKLIHSGKVLKDTQTLSETGISENEFLVCMVTKEAVTTKPKPQTQSTPTPTTQSQVSTPAPQVTQSQQRPTPQNIPVSTTTTTPTVTQQSLNPQTQTPTAPTRETTVNPEAVRQLMDMGFPQEEATTALRAAMGNADVAVEFLMNGIPPHALAAAGMGGGGGNMGVDEDYGDDSFTGGSGIDQLRALPQLNELRRVVQSNPAALQQVLEAIGQQNPELLQLIHANQAEFLQLMNEPITEDPTPRRQTQQVPPQFNTDGQPNPMQLIQMIQMLPPEQRAQAAQSLGMTPEQLQAFTQMISTLPPDQLQQLMGQANQMGIGGGGGGGPPPGANVIRLTEEEMNAVNRLTEMGFDQQDAVAAYLACDKNEALAANLLLEGWNADGQGGF